MNEIVNYVNRAFAHIPESRQRTEMMQEIIGRLEDDASAWMEKGKAHDDAINKAIVDFGDIGEILEELREQSAPVDEIKRTGAKNALYFSIIGSLSIIALMVFINFYYSPGVIWYVYPTFAIIWWPLSVFFFGRWRKYR